MARDYDINELFPTDPGTGLQRQLFESNEHFDQRIAQEKARQASQQQAQQTTAAQQQGQTAAQQQSQQQQDYFNRSMGGSASDYLRQANAAARGQAQRNAGIAADQAARRAVSAGRTSGLNPAQAAQMAGQSEGDVYTNAYLGNFGQQLGQYGNATNMAGQQALGYGNLGLGYGQSAQQGALSQQQLAMQRQNQQWQQDNALGLAIVGGLGQAAAGAASAGALGVARGAGGAGAAGGAGGAGAAGAAAAAAANGARNFQGGKILVGEKGPEVVNLPPGSDVVPNKPEISKLAGLAEKVTKLADAWKAGK